jgi:predicted O-methyltransferase YrrM
MNVLRFKLVIGFIVYRFTAKSRKGYGIHSPFVFDFTQKVLSQKGSDVQLTNIQLQRKKIMKQNERIATSNFGVGSKMDSKTISVAQAVRNQSVSHQYGKLLYNLCRFTNSQNVLEIGTSIGISTMYLASASSNGKVFTLEGDEKRLEFAKRNLEALKLNNVHFIHGNFDVTLPSILSKISKVDYVFFDGNHSKEATLKYFGLCMDYIYENTVFVFDDIRWSDEMKVAWDEIIADDRVSISIDLFFMGIVFFRKGVIKQHFNIIY